MKFLIKDYCVVVYSLRYFDKFEVNEEGRKVCWKDFFLDWDEIISFRFVVVVNLLMENLSIENVVEMFFKCGEVSFIRILRSGKLVL